MLCAGTLYLPGVSIVTLQVMLAKKIQCVGHCHTHCKAGIIIIILQMRKVQLNEIIISLRVYSLHKVNVPGPQDQSRTEFA